MSESELRKSLIKLAHENPHMRKDLLPLLSNTNTKQAAGDAEKITVKVPVKFDLLIPYTVDVVNGKCVGYTDWSYDQVKAGVANRTVRILSSINPTLNQIQKEM